GKYINGEDPRSAEQSYLFMLGYRKDRASGLMIPAVCPITGDTTTFVLAGDPVTDSGWVDSSPADRRFMMSSGPFTMEPGDTQEVVCAVLVGQGSSPLSSITALKQIDEGAQAVFDLNFDIPMPPPAPEIYIRGGDGFIDLAWSNDAVGDIQMNEALGQEFHFEGFNLYEGETSVGPWHKFATFDVDNDVGLIYTDVVDAEAGGTQRTIAQKGENTGLEFHRLIERDEITGGMLMDNRPYFFAVTAYSYDVNDTSMFYDPGGNLLGHLVATLESPIVAYEVRPMTHIGAFSEQAKHVSGGSDGTVYIEYIYPDEVTGDEYEVSFNEDLTWNLKNITTGDTLLANQTNQDDNFDYPVQEGIMVRATGLPPGIVDWDWEGSERWLSGVDCGGDFFFGGLMNGPDFFGSNVTATDYVSVEIRFSFTTTQKAVLYTRGADPSYGYTGYYDCPFTVWDVTSSPERQLNVCFVENEGEDSQDSSWLPGATNGGREYLFIMNSDYSETPNPLYTQATIWDVIGDGPDGDCDCLYAMWPSRRGDRDPYEYLQDGQKFIIIASKPNIPADKFRFVTKRATESDGDFIALSLDNIKTVPNPYYAFYEEEVDQFDRMMKFINVPPADMKIRIFNLAGDLVRTMDVTVAEVFAGGGEIYWDLKTDEDMWVASGIYVWLIEADGIGSKFGKMAIFTEVEQLTNF
ncbi:MAG: hypothetical protein KAT58_05495, partial [candidate division Zixibacteria bacterium]|nr:hypothetical protein [candidate division Zixibacteria bacterium]